MKDTPNDVDLIQGYAIKHSAVVQIASDQVTAFQRKLWNVLLVNAYHELERKPLHEIDLYPLRVALDAHDFDLIKAAVRALESIVVEFNVLESRSKKTWVSSSLLSAAKIKENSNTLTYEYSTILKEMLVHPDVYARVSLSIQRRFNSKYTLIMYELACDHFIAGRGFGETPWVCLTEFRKLMGCADDSYYDDFRNFNRRVIQKAKNEVNEQSDLQVNISYRRQKRKVDAIKMTIRAKNDMMSVVTQLFGPQQGSMPLAPGGEMYERLIAEYKLTSKQATDIVTKFSTDYIKDKLTYITMQIRSGKVKNIGAFTSSAFTDGYVTPPATPLLQTSPAQEPKYELKDGTRVKIGSKVYAVEDGIIQMKDGSMPYGMIVQGIKEGKYKIVS